MFALSCATPHLGRRPADNPEARKLAELAYQKVQAGNSKIKTIKAIVNVRPFSGGTRHIVVISKPESLRVDTIGLLGEVLHQLIYYKKHYRIDGSCRRPPPPSPPPSRGGGEGEGEPSRHPSIQKGLSNLDLEIDLVIRILSGEIPLEEKENYLATRKKGSILMRGMKSEVLLDPVSFLPKVFTSVASGGKSYRVSVGDYRSVSGIFFPHSIKVFYDGMKLGLDYEDIILNEKIPSRIFKEAVLQ